MLPCDRSDVTLPVAILFIFETLTLLFGLHIPWFVWPDVVDGNLCVCGVCLGKGAFTVPSLLRHIALVKRLFVQLFLFFDLTWLLVFLRGRSHWRKSRDSTSADARFHSNFWESGNAISEIQESLDVPSPGELVITIACFYIKRFLYGFSKDCVPATHGSAKFVLWRLQYSLLCCCDGRFNAVFFSLLRPRLIVFEKPNQQIQEKCQGGYFRRDNRDQLVPGFQTGPMSIKRSRMILRQECCDIYLSEFRKQTGRQSEKHKEANINAWAREKKASWHGYIPRHAGCRMTMRLTQNNSVTMIQMMRRNPSMQNRTILIQRDRALSLCFFVFLPSNSYGVLYS